MDEDDVVALQSGLLLSHQKERTLAIGQGAMPPEGIMLSEIRRRKTNAIGSPSFVEFEKQNT